MRGLLSAALLLPVVLPGQVARDTTPPDRVFGVTEWQLARQKLEAEMTPDGFTVYIIADMEGLAGAVRNATEMRPEYRGGEPAHERFREELTDEVNAVIAGARAGGATQFVVNDGHGGTLFRNVLPDRLDPEALLIRGYPKPIVMSTGLNPMVDGLMIVGAHANAGSPGIIAHNFAFDSFTVNGVALNEAGIAAFIGGEMGVPFLLASGDDVLTAETAAMLGPIETVTVKTAFSGSAAAVLPPARVHRMLHDAAERAVRRARAGELKPLTFAAPYRVRLCLRRGYARDEWVRTTVGTFGGMTPDGAEGCFAMTTSSAEAVGNVLNEIEWTVLKP
ncbi:MAG: M55 family metallopeptidase [Gemmatimonadetes bacterium]|nr:M55 family metallopeptidase [Gemmatimonadota bacterium]MCB9505021.1 M55 family metallopeptidase [Gemmatimonadales bacterium]MCA9762058.1 M55 family metallopeptidase [Gemmatimonadota bacterium]MCA9767927.1 M55 family metallopeptidase [Gemmatimonadota bacterium]MCB9517724.1 M55 family metallopeptidase [Gemmatimonadales bacterium]